MDAQMAGLSNRPMRLKVLYTFDTENKNNCLARWPQVLNVQTAALDGTTLIGVVELKTCIQAITSSSPELISNVGNDFNIYAYDYSEPETPLVGQGLLSWAMAATTADVEEEDGSPNLVTGRVTRGGLGLFARDAQETLEVKLRLRPVPSSTHDDYINGLQKHKQASEVIGQQFDGQAWTAFMQNSPGFISSNVRPQSAVRSASPMDTTQLGAMQRVGSDRPVHRARSGSLPVGPLAVPNILHPPSRTATPALARPLNPAPVQQGGLNSRPNSRAGIQQSTHLRSDSFHSGYFSAEEATEEGPARKRAKITKVDGLSKSNLNIERQPESLRVAASTASSVRLHRPVPVNPRLAIQAGMSAEDPVRPPTPVPKRRGRPARNGNASGSSHLRRGSNANASSPIRGRVLLPAEPQAAPQSQPLDTAMSSPENAPAPSISSNPPNIPSSPPVMDTVGMLPSSPALPPLAAEHDSGFMSGNLDDFFNNGGTLQFDEYLKANEGQSEAAAPIGQNGVATAPDPSAPLFEECNNAHEPPSLPLQPAQSPRKAKRPKPSLERAQTSRPVSPRLGIENISETKESTKALNNVPQGAQVPASEPIGPSLHRSNTWAGDMSNLPASDAPLGDGSQLGAAAKQKKRIGKEQTKARLEAAIASGDLPPYCENCGTIETPAWRRAFARTFEGGYDQFETSLMEGEPCFKEPLDHNEDGSVKTFRAFKVVRKPEDREDQWVLINLCNPCGLWFHKFKCMRPPEKYDKSRKEPKGRRKRSARSQAGRNAARKAKNGADAKSDTQTPGTDASSPSDTATEAAEANEGDNDGEGDVAGDADETNNEPELPPMPKASQASNADDPVMRITGGGLAIAFQTKQRKRGVQSSPERAHGSEAEPIEIDLTPKSVRRQLFSSPIKATRLPNTALRRGAAIPRPLADLPNFVRRSPRINNTKEAIECPTTPGRSVDKENQSPGRSAKDGLEDLFNDEEDGPQVLPKTPTPTRRSDRILFKTPSKTPRRTPGGSFSPTTLRCHGTAKDGTSHHPVAAALLGSNKNTAEMTPFTRQIHRLLSDAPNHQTQSSPTGPPTEYRQRTPRGASSKEGHLDFPDLPSLKNSSPMSHGYAHINFSELTTDHLQTDFNDFTDMPMPSSPPIGFFNFIDTHDDGMGIGGSLWSDLDLGLADASSHGTGYPDPVASAMGQAVSHGPRRSPRKK